MTEHTRSVVIKFALAALQVTFAFLLFAGVSTFIERSFERLSAPAAADAARRAEIERLNQYYVGLSGEVRRLRQELQVIASTPNLPADMRLKALDAQLADVTGRLQKLEQAIEQNPAKAIELPILRHDLDALRERYVADTEQRKQDIERVYDLNKWFVGLVISAVIALVTLAITSYFKPGDTKATEHIKRSPSEP